MSTKNYAPALARLSPNQAARGARRGAGAQPRHVLRPRVQMV